MPTPAAIKLDTRITGLDPIGIVRMIGVGPVGTDAVTLCPLGAGGGVAGGLLSRTDRSRLWVPGASEHRQPA